MMEIILVIAHPTGFVPPPNPHFPMNQLLIPVDVIAVFVCFSTFVFKAICIYLFVIKFLAC